MLIVIFGAGASYDSAPSYPPQSHESRQENVVNSRPPLADELFSNRPFFAGAISKFPRCQALIPDLRHLNRGESVERVLQRFQEQAETYEERHCQLAAIRFYLQSMMMQCERHWFDLAKGVTNYTTLLDQLEFWRNKRKELICLVTFNYDRILEAALPTVDITIGKLPHYISSDHYKVIKLHGSVNWGREIIPPTAEFSQTGDNLINEVINRAAELNISQSYQITEKMGRVGQAVFFPAIAIPVERKRVYECPPDHLEVLTACIPKITKLMIIGWRATEYNFLHLLVENLRENLKGIVVSGSSESAKEVIARLNENGIAGSFIASKGGFTDFILRHEADEFLKS